MSVARNSMHRFPYYTYKEVPGFGNGFGGFRLMGAAASPSVAIVVGTNTAASTSGTNSATGSVIKTTTDGVVWSSVATTSFGNNGITQIAYGNDVFVAMGGSNTIATSPGTSGTTWTQRTSPASGTGAWWYLTFQNNIFVALNTTGTTYTSSDGITWSAGASVDNNNMQTYNYPAGKGGIFYISNNPSTAKWLQVYGQLFATTAQTHAAVLQDITSSGTISSTYATSNAGSWGPQWFADDNRLLITVASNTTAGFTGHPSAVPTIKPPTASTVSSLPMVDVPAGVFFPSVMPRIGSISIGASTGSTVLSQFSDLSVIANPPGGGAQYKKSFYVYNDGYYNCLYNANTIIPSNGNFGTVIQTPTVNVAFRADDPAYAESVQIIGTTTVPQAGVSPLGSNIGSRSGGFGRAIDVKFKGDSYIFFVWYDNSDIFATGYYKGARSIKPLRTTIGLGVG